MTHKNSLDFIKTMAVSQGLIFLHEEATPHKAERFALYLNGTCLTASEDLGHVEHYIFGFRDGLMSPPENTLSYRMLENTLTDIDTLHNQITGVRELVFQIKRTAATALQHLSDPGNE